MQNQSQAIESIFNAKYELREIIGCGAFSEVRVGIERYTGHQFAIKIIDRSKCKGKEDMIETEVRILKMIKHENIIQLYEMFEFNGKIYLVMELVTGGELFDEITQRGTFNERDAAAIVQKILSAIKYLHEMGIVHRDLKVIERLIKPENLLLSDRSRNPRVKISDFGLSKIFKDQDILKTACGTPGYVGITNLIPAPEILKKRGYGPQVDMWSLGVITYILLCGYPPFFDSSNSELFKKIMAGRFQFDRPWWDNISEKAKDFICKLLIVEPKLRWTAAEALQHPFIVENCYSQRYIPTMDIASKLPPHGIPATTIYRNPGKSIKVPTIIPKHKVKPFQPKMDIDSNISVETVCSKPQAVDQNKAKFTAKVNRIASWFRTATFVERTAAKPKTKYTPK
ncbi:hypothetical protein HDV01_007644 [Terramyces sp. JEL0728]|nr:hypothetical protein HDV01_007644 [Terramyces sp. JEL0728]